MEAAHAVCRVCRAGVAIRISRYGFFQQYVLSALGYFPWKCGACGETFFYKSRGYASRSARSRDVAAEDLASRHAVAQPSHPYAHSAHS